MKSWSYYLVMNFPRLWRSRIHYIIAGSLIATLLIFGLIDNLDHEGTGDYNGDEYSDRDIFGYFGLVLWSIFVLIWLYSQYQNEPKLRRFSFWEVLSGSMLNLICLIVLVLPFLPMAVLTIDDGGMLEDVMESLMIVSYLLFLPILFLAFIIRYYNLQEIILVLIGGFGYCLLWVFILESIGTAFDLVISLALMHYLLALIYVLFKFASRRHNRFDKWLIFALIVLAPEFIGFLLPIVGFGDRDFILDASFDYVPVAFLSTFVLLICITWYVTKSLRKPIIIK